MNDTQSSSTLNGSYIDCLVAIAKRKGAESLPSDLKVRFQTPPISRWQEISRGNVEHDPTLQSALARSLDYPPSKWLLEREVSVLQRVRELHTPDNPLPDYTDGKADVYQWAREGQLTGLCLSGGGIRSATFNLGILQGLASNNTSGHDDKVGLTQLDYLSSVSGGGYIHSWLAAWFNRQAKAEYANHPQQPDQAMRDGFDQVVDEMKPPPKQSPKTWPRQVEWLRRYSNYLTPEVGLLTGDTWAMVATWLRNVSLNQSLLLSLCALMLMLPHCMATNVWVAPPPAFAPSQSKTIATVHTSKADASLVLQVNVPAPATADHDKSGQTTSWCEFTGFHPFMWLTEPLSWSAWIGLGALAIGIAGLCYLLRREYTRTRGDDEVERQREKPAKQGDQARSLNADGRAELRETQKNPRKAYEWWIVLGVAIVPLFLFGASISQYVIAPDPDLEIFTWTLLLELALLVWVGTFCGGALNEWTSRSESERQSMSWKGTRWFLRGVTLVLIGTPAAVAGTLGGVGIALLLRSRTMVTIESWLYLNNPRPVQMVFGTLMFAWLPLVVLVIAAGLVGRWFPSWLGEWLARIRGYSLLSGLAWLVLCGTSLLAPGVVAHASHSEWIGWSTVLTWAGSTLASVLGGKSATTSGDKDSSASPRVLNALVVVGPYVYILGLMVGLAWVLNAIQIHYSSGRPFWLFCFLVPGVVTLIFGFTLDINEFSMHSFYRNRLTRCYLGASNLNRDPSRITGFDDRDTRGLQIARLQPVGSSSGDPHVYPGPYPIFCCSMNITHGEDLGWQERKAASFAFTPLYSGYDVPCFEGPQSSKITYNGYVPTRDYAYPGGPNLATAMAASGAAISPNWGYHTNPALAFLLTMFDVRLGWWIPNPRRSRLAGRQISTQPEKLDHSSPVFVPLWLGQELLGSIKDTSAFVYLTDGGHFDNMGLYELVRRRCYRIVICDAEEDSSYIYEGIGNAIRKCRLDFGVEIDLNLSDLTPNTKSKLSPAHIVKGTVRYPETPPDKKGTVIYVKASLTAAKPVPPGPVPAKIPGEVQLPDVPGDVQNYKLQHTAFPHDSTVNQWFTESQFESYRRLGQAVAEYIAW